MDLFLEDVGYFFYGLVGGEFNFYFDMEVIGFLAEGDVGFGVGDDFVAGIFGEVDEGGAGDGDFAFVGGGDMDNFSFFCDDSPED